MLQVQIYDCIPQRAGLCGLYVRLTKMWRAVLCRFPEGGVGGAAPAPAAGGAAAAPAANAFASGAAADDDDDLYS